MEPTTPSRSPDLELRKFELEEKKVALEYDKIRIDKLRAWVGSASTFGSLIVVAGTIALGIWSQYEQAKLQHELLDRQAKAQFELKAAEIVMSTDNPDVTLNKARAIQSLFPQYLSTTFAESFVPQSFARPDPAAATAAGEGDRKPANPRRLMASAKPPRAVEAELSYRPEGRPKVYKVRTPTRPPIDPYDPAEGIDESEPAARLASEDASEKTTKPAPTPVPTPSNP